MLFPPDKMIYHAPSLARNTIHRITVGLTLEHRFAFYYWAKFFNEFKEQDVYLKDPPIFLSIDSHYDVGDASTLQQYKRPLKTLENKLYDSTLLSRFCWQQLNSNNDTQISAALYMNYFSDAYILMAEDQFIKFGMKMPIVKDRQGKVHTIHYYHHIEDVVKDLKLRESPIFLDIDLDYFTEELGEGSDPHVLILPDNDVRDILNTSSAIMSVVLPRVVGLTIALEPNYCGNIVNSAHLLNLLDIELFDKTLFTRDVQWNIKLD